MVSPPTANPKTRSRSASSKASTTKSASSRDEPTDCATTNISASKCSPACCRRYDPPKSPTRFPEDPIKDWWVEQYFVPTTAAPAHRAILHSLLEYWGIFV